MISKLNCYHGLDEIDTVSAPKPLSLEEHIKRIQKKRAKFERKASKKSQTQYPKSIQMQTTPYLKSNSDFKQCVTAGTVDGISVCSKCWHEIKSGNVHAATGNDPQAGSTSGAVTSDDLGDLGNSPSIIATLQAHKHLQGDRLAHTSA